jgi:cytochrome c553
MEETPKKKIKFSLLSVLMTIAGLIWIGVILHYLNSIPDINKLTSYDIKNVISRDTAVVPDLETVKGKPMKGVNVMEVGFPNPTLIAKGETLFKSTCASCHGDKGMGDGAGGATLTPKPRNFHEKAGWKNGREIASMYKTLAEGIPGSGMIAYEFMPAEDRFALIHYVRQFAADFPPITAGELAQIDNVYDLASPRLSASQIPVAKAETKVILDSKELSDKASKCLSAISKQTGASAELFNRISDSKSRAIMTLLRDESWKSNTGAFVHEITFNIGRNGFKPSVAKLSKGEVDMLFTYLKTHI